MRSRRYDVAFAKLEEWRVTPYHHVLSQVDTTFDLSSSFLGPSLVYVLGLVYDRHIISLPSALLSMAIQVSLVVWQWV